MAALNIKMGTKARKCVKVHLQSVGRASKGSLVCRDGGQQMSSVAQLNARQAGRRSGGSMMRQAANSDCPSHLAID